MALKCPVTGNACGSPCSKTVCTMRDMQRSPANLTSWNIGTKPMSKLRPEDKRDLGKLLERYADATVDAENSDTRGRSVAVTDAINTKAAIFALFERIANA